MIAINSIVPCILFSAEQNRTGEATYYMIATGYPLFLCVQKTGVIEVDKEPAVKFLVGNHVFSFLSSILQGNPRDPTNKHEEVVETNITVKNTINVHQSKMN